ncbi:hypothetical protein ALQ90_200349 [Pseudomonas savastanoi pv. savastanoi]|nr:hypothetical protein DXU85_26090 [Pseudomonas savastanoi]RML72900.1 hypothetical protein ALQ90_200349 [Pseudomonas savastanoi pv. savastanoi]RXT68488.1 hypothetical protein B1F74_01655 [Pseudomonas syringae]
MHTTATTIHVHPRVTDPLRVFEVRHLAVVHGCTFIPSKPKLRAVTKPLPFDPNDGGRAA